MTNPIKDSLASLGAPAARVQHLTADNRFDIREAVALAMKYWPNAHLGEISRREDLRGAFRYIRVRIDAGWSIQRAVGSLSHDAYCHSDM